VSAARISIEDGAFFKGGIDIRKPDSKPLQATGTSGPVAVAESSAVDSRGAQQGVERELSAQSKMLASGTSASASRGACVS
jgi:hypothetical protein